MHKHVMAAVCVASMIAGCGGGGSSDPDNSVLSNGRTAKVVQGAAGQMQAVLTKEDGMTSLGILTAGTKVTVQNDPGEFTENDQDLLIRAAADKENNKVIRREGKKTFPASSPFAKRRRVGVTVVDGPLKGATGQVYRFVLVPE